MQGAHHTVRPVTGTVPRHRRRGGATRPDRVRARLPGPDPALLDDAGDEQADRAQGPAAGADHDRGLRGHRPDRPGEPVVGRDPVQGAAQHRRRRQAGAADPQGPDRGRQGTRRLPRRDRATTGRGSLPGPAGPVGRRRRARVRRVAAVVVHESGARAADPGTDRARVQRDLPRQHAGLPVQPGLAPQAGVHAHHDDHPQRVPAPVDVRGADRASARSCAAAATRLR